MLNGFVDILSTPVARGLVWLIAAIAMSVIGVLLWKMNLSLTLSALKKRREALALQVSLIEREKHYLERMRADLQNGSTE